MKTITEYINMLSPKDYVFESMNKYFSDKEIGEITKDMWDKNNGEFPKFIKDKINHYTQEEIKDYLENQCIDDNRCTSEFAAYIAKIIGRKNFSLEQVRKFIKTNDL